MDFAKILFETMDKMLYKSYNESVEIEGAENITILNNEKYCNLNNIDYDMDIYYGFSKE